MDEIKNPHDLFFKETLSNIDNARSFLESYLPQELLTLLDLAHLEIEKDSFVSQELREYFSDLLYKVRLLGEDGYVYILFEHKSYQESWIGLQLLEYMVQCWKLKREQKEKLPVIVPLVLYHGEKAWKSGRIFSTLLACQDERLRKYIPDFEYLLYDLTTCSDEELRGIATLRVLLRLFKHIHEPRLAGKLTAILRVLASETAVSREFLITMTIYILNTTQILAEDLSQMVRDSVSKEGGTLVMTTAQELIEKGIEKGKIEGKIEAIETALEIKFGAASLGVLPQIEKIHDLEQLSKIYQLVIKASGWQECLSGLTPLLGEQSER